MFYCVLFPQQVLLGKEIIYYYLWRGMFTNITTKYLYVLLEFRRTLIMDKNNNNNEIREIKKRTSDGDGKQHKNGDSINE